MIEEIDGPEKIKKNLLIHQDAERAPAEETGEAIYAFLEERNCAFIKIPGWVTNEQYGVWMEKAFVHINEESEDAYRVNSCSGTTGMSNVLRWGKAMDEGREARAKHKLKLAKDFTHDEGRFWLPKSLIEYGYHAGGMEREDRLIVTSKGGAITIREDSLSSADMNVYSPHKFFWTDKEGESRHKEKLYMDVEYEDREAVKSLEWDEHHVSYNEDEGAWEIDAEGLEDAVDKLALEGYDVCVPDHMEPYWS